MTTEQTKQYAVLEEPTISVDEFLRQVRPMIEEYRDRQYGRTHIEDSEEYQTLLCKVLGHNIVPDYFEREEYHHCCGCMRLAKDLMVERNESST